MQTVKKIIDLFGGLEALKANPLKIEAEGFMPLSVEYIGIGLRRLPLVSVMHYYEQNGDLMRDPDMEFEIDQQGEWHPISYRQDSLGMLLEAVFQDPDTGKVLVRPKLVRELKTFMRTWSRNLAEQGFLDAARQKAGEQESQS